MFRFGLFLCVFFFFKLTFIIIKNIAINNGFFAIMLCKVRRDKGHIGKMLYKQKNKSPSSWFSSSYSATYKKMILLRGK